MNHYVVYTDSGCDIAPELLKEWGVYSSSLTFRFDGDEIEYSNNDMTVTEFYNRMRAGGVAKTAAINVGTFLDEFEKLLAQGLDILYLGFSSKLSSTYSSAEIAAQQLRSQYPERTIITVDTLSASAGQEMLVYLAQEKKLAGASLQETAAYIEELKLRIAHWVTAEDLVYLKRGGRISSTAAVVGNVLGIKPIIHMDNEGGLVSVAKVRGRKNSIAALADKFAELAVDPVNDIVFLCHSDCENEAEELATVLTQKYCATVGLVTDIGPVIGAHTGPGTVAVFFIGKER